jgi:hypothetical protein
MIAAAQQADAAALVDSSSSSPVAASDRHREERGDVQRIFGYPSGFIQSNPMRLGFMQMDIRIQTASIQ